jgi:hypothetical protein
MSNNPLQKYFRQPKIFISLPSKGVWTKPGTIQGDATHLPVFGMTGMDEIIMKTPDALLTGDSTAQVISSCCPNIKDPWDVSVTDIMLILAAIRISTYGDSMVVRNTCAKCQSENEYQMDLNKIIEHYMACKFQTTVTLNNMIIRIQPLSYKDSTEFNLRNFRLQQQIEQISQMEDQSTQQDKYKELYQEIGNVQVDILKKAIEDIEIDGQKVTERSYIEEWILNCDKSVIDAIRELNISNNDTWAPPKFKVECDSCQAESELRIELDESNFFVKA